MSHLPALLACALLLAGPALAQEDGEQEESAPAETSTEAEAPSAPAPAPLRRAGQPFRPGARPAAPSPAPSSGGGAVEQRSADDDEAQSLGGVGISRGSTEGRERLPASGGGAPAPASGGGGGSGGAGFQEIDIGLIPTIAHLRNGRGGDRPVIHVAGGKKWAIKLQSKGSGRANYNILLGGTNGDLTGGGKYRFKAAISKSKGVVSGPGALCEGQMHNAAYVTCSGACNMSWDLRFGTPAKDRRPNGGTCELDHGQVYYLNVAPEGNGCSGGQAEGFGCPLVMEPSNGAQIFLNPSGPAAACAHRGFGYEGGTCR